MNAAAADERLPAAIFAAWRGAGSPMSGSLWRGAAWIASGRDRTNPQDRPRDFRRASEIVVLDPPALFAVMATLRASR